MAAEMPVKVEPVDGADVVDFPWADARAAVAALNRAAATLGTQLETRASMGSTIADWTGAFRTEFDTALTRITGLASGLKETLTRMGYWIVSGAEAANQEQRTSNGKVSGN